MSSKTFSLNISKNGLGIADAEQVALNKCVDNLGLFYKINKHSTSVKTCQAIQFLCEIRRNHLCARRTHQLCNIATAVAIFIFALRDCLPSISF